MKTSEQFEQAIQSFPKEMQALARQTRSLIYQLFPQVVEVVWVPQKNTGFGTGIKKKTEHFCWLMPATNHVSLGFNYGAELPDPHHLLEGTGKLFRHVKIKSVAQLSNPHLIELIIYATSYRVPAVKTTT